MKKMLGMFLAGMLAGGLIFLLIVNFNDDKQAPGNLNVKPVLFEKPGNCLSYNNFRVFQGLSAGYGLAVELEKGTYSNMESASGVVVLLYSPDGKQYEDGEFIKVSKGKCARHVGEYTYTLQNGDKKTVPMVQITDKDEEE